MKEVIGQVVNNFEIQDILGEGSMGIVYRAYHPDLQRYTAIKVLRPEMISIPDSFERFLQEARTAAQLQHENIVNVINFGEIEDSYYLMMEYVEGASMRELVEENRQGIAVADLAVIFTQIADVLEFAHDEGVLHRDLKPDNILLTNNEDEPDGQYRAMVSDFGLVKIAHGESLTQTVNGMTLGTPAYMSPEQCTGTDTDARSDIYSLGVTMYEAATGQRPYPIRNLFDAVKFHTSGKLVPPKALNPDIPNRLNILIRQMLNPDPDKRPASAAEVKKRLARFLPNARSIRQSQIHARLREGAGYVPDPTDSQFLFSSIREETLKEVSKPISRCIVVTYKGRVESVYPPLVEGERLIVGRSSNVDIVLGRKERYVSKQHCEIVVVGNRVEIRDLESTNGTFIGETRIGAASTEWPEDQDINLGGYKLSLRSVSEGEKLKDEGKEEERTVIQGQFILSCVGAKPDLVNLAGDPVIVGRLPACQMILPNGRVSKKHLQIETEGDQVFVTDLDSTNGSSLNGVRLTPGTKVSWDGNAPLKIADYEILLTKPLIGTGSG